MAPEGRYHHGDLRRAVLAAAVEAIEERGLGLLSLRDVARRAGVSHTAPVHHFGDKAGMLTALATEGFDLLAQALDPGDGETIDLVDAGVIYVQFAVDHRAHFEVMFRPDLHHPDEPALAVARDRAGDLLTNAVVAATDTPPGQQTELASVAAWSLVHGFATLWLAGALPEQIGQDLQGSARSVAKLLFSVVHRSDT
ncbi:TetR/AcrR family transcriptional regulator [Streptomyces sp. GXMU-J15]|uniref:TetR/AcrR family transcriptional regulator n=1 Tax=Streptomyces fuscus TaxID=3048495 RepID=A0ABT7IXV9_9ACTN|nr:MULTISPECIES: TetR/AcrR family transcriptional regulator [Streptomyces]MDL2076367.1 TetR/AcrR family transcriptional regulator [Streptomyces fuscus]SBT89051.1 transcriptional regulator, TetR family [Streptomyces sp. DI166]